MKLPGPIALKPDPSGGLLKRIRTLMANEGGVQKRLNLFAAAITSSLKVNVASIYLRTGDTLELCATKGLKQSAVHKTRLNLNEGLVGLVARQAQLINTADAPQHTEFSYRPETGEEKFSSFLGVPLLRGGRNLGVLVIQNKKSRTFTEAEVETLLTAATLLAEIAVEDERAGGSEARIKGIRLSPTRPETVVGKTFSDGLARGLAYMHYQPVLAEQMISSNPAQEESRLEDAIQTLRQSVDALIGGESAQLSRATKDIFESYRMFAYDRKWLSRLREAVYTGLTAEAAVERVRSEHRARMLKARDPYLRARLHDLEDLANRLLRILSGELPQHGDLPKDAIVFARNLGPAEILDYGSQNLRGIVLEEGAQTAHATIICRSLGIPLIGMAEGVLDRVEPGDLVLLDGEFSTIYIRPTSDEIENYQLREQLRSDLFRAFEKQRDLESKTLDGRKISLMLNAGLLADLPQIKTLGADGIGLFRTELQFMVSEKMPKLSEQIDLYKRALQAGGESPVTFRTLDLGGDKILPYADTVLEENPALGWRAIRIGLDRPALLRMQLRALLMAGAGAELRLMFPMVTTVREFLDAKAHLKTEIKRLKKLNHALPARTRTGVMLETPALAWQVDAICKHVDFVSIGANDLMQFFFAADRDNPRVAGRYEGLHPAALSLLAHVAERCRHYKIPVTICGEMAGHALEALALIAIGFDTLSMPGTGVGPVKAALLALDSNKLAAEIQPLLKSDVPVDSVRPKIIEFCKKQGIPF